MVRVPKISGEGQNLRIRSPILNPFIIWISSNMPGTRSMTTTATVRPTLELRDSWSELDRSPPRVRPDDNRETQPHLTSVSGGT